MADPTGYEPDYSFSDYQKNRPSKPLPAPELDIELANISEAINGVAGAVKDIRRADGRLKSGIVDKEALSVELLASWGSGGGGNGGGEEDAEPKYTASDTSPLNPELGDRWFNTLTGKEYTWLNGWVETTGGGGSEGSSGIVEVLLAGDGIVVDTTTSGATDARPRVSAVRTFFESGAALQSARVDASVRVLTIGGHTAPGDGGRATLRRVPAATASVQFRSADGALWQNAERILTPFMFGAKGDCTGLNSGTGQNPVGTNDLPAFDACYAAARALRRGMSIPPANYRLSGPFVMDTTPTFGSIFNWRPPVFGLDARGTQLCFDRSPGNGLVLKGGVGTDDNVSYQSLRGLSIMKDANKEGDGAGLLLEGHNHASVRDIRIHGFEFGLQAVDVHECNFDNVVTSFAKKGMFFAHKNFTRPNIITLVNCTVGAAADYGIDLLSPSTFEMIGGSIEGINFQRADPAGKWAFRAQFSSVDVEGSVAANLFGVYFENNHVDFDVWYRNDGVADYSLNLYGCDFKRANNERFSKNCVKLEGGSSSKHNINLIGCGFRQYPQYGYVPSALRPYISNDLQGNYQLTDIGNTWSGTLELPNVGLFTFSTRSQRRVSVRYDGSGTGLLRNRGANNVVRNGVGDYTINYLYPFDGGNNFVSFSTVGDRRVFITAEEANYIRVQLVNSAGSPVDGALTVNVEGT